MELPWFRDWRPYQAEAVIALRTALASGARAICLNAPTGSGKSLIAYAAIAERGGTIACYSRVLQSQYHSSFEIPVLFGKQNYRCTRFPMLTVDLTECALTGVPEAGCSCPYFTARERAKFAPVHCINHALVVHERGIVRPVLIVDEAHRFPDAVRSAMSLRVSPKTIAALAVRTPVPSQDWLLEASTAFTRAQQEARARADFIAAS